MTTLSEKKISKEDQEKFFPEESGHSGDPYIEISTRQEFGKKTIIGLQVSIIRKEDRGTYTIKGFCCSSPCVRITMCNPMPMSRKNFLPEIKKDVDYWLEKTTIDPSHPYFQAMKDFASSIEK